ncbi:MAG: glycosyltransferase [Candidatus Geothermincolales bacterium]
MIEAEKTLDILLVTYRFGADITGGAERYLWGLSERLSQRGHRVKVITTCSRDFYLSPLGYLVWDSHYPEGEREEDGIQVARFAAENLSPRRARRYRDAIMRFEETIKRDPEGLGLFVDLLRGRKEHCFLVGWKVPEDWIDGPAMWMVGEGILVAGGDEIDAVVAEFDCLEKVKMTLDANGARRDFPLHRGRVKVEMELPGLPSVAIRFTCSSTRRKRKGPLVALRSLMVRDKEGWRELRLARSWQDFLGSGPEEVICELLWKWGDRMPEALAARHALLYGPNSEEMSEAVTEAAGSADLVLAAMLPMATMEMAGEAARRWNKPLISIPLFHPRDPNHYRKSAWDAIRISAGVEVFHEGAVSLLSSRGIRAFGLGPGFDEHGVEPRRCDGKRLREELGLDDQPMLLWVGRKNEGKGYPEAIEALSILRGKGIDAVLVMVGPEEDGKPISGEGVFYLGKVDRETLLDAYAASTLLIHPSIHESFCMVFGEAWLMERPVLGSSYCLAARSLIRDGENGFLCTDPEDYAEKAEWLILRPEVARSMGRKGKERVLSLRRWDRVIEAMEEELIDVVKQSKSGAESHPKDVI